MQFFEKSCETFLFTKVAASHEVSFYMFNPCGESDQTLVHQNLLKMAERSEKKLRVKTSQFSRFTRPFFANLSGQLIGHFPRRVRIVRIDKNVSICEFVSQNESSALIGLV